MSQDPAREACCALRAENLSRRNDLNGGIRHSLLRAENGTQDALSEEQASKLLKKLFPLLYFVQRALSSSRWTTLDVESARTRVCGDW